MGYQQFPSVKEEKIQRALGTWEESRCKGCGIILQRNKLDVRYIWCKTSNEHPGTVTHSIPCCPGCGALIDVSG